MLWTLYNDDICEEATPFRSKHVHGQSIAILNGDLIVEKADIPLASLLVSLREELLQLISAESLQRFVSAFDRYFSWNRNLLTKGKNISYC
jgi:phytoene dehydrogenase-like protein